MKNAQKLKLDVKITDLSEYWKGDFEKLPANKTYKLIIDYPLSRVAEFLIKTGKNGMGLFPLLTQIGKKYEQVYENEERHGVWGHNIDQLCLEGISIDHRKQTIRLDVGS